jgi:hypothetical protein
MGPIPGESFHLVLRRQIELFVAKNKQRVRALGKVPLAPYDGIPAQVLESFARILNVVRDSTYSVRS